MSKKVNIGIIGAGRIGKVHAETIAFRIQEATPCAITDIYKEAAKQVAERCHFESPYYFSRLFRRITGQTPSEFRGSWAVNTIRPGSGSRAATNPARATRPKRS